MISNCYTLVEVRKNCFGICGSGNTTSSVGDGVTIMTSYASGKLISDSQAFSIADPSQNFVILNSYPHNKINHIKGRLGKLPEQFWQVEHDHLPTLRH